jgi:hypothetical protein
LNAPPRPSNAPRAYFEHEREELFDFLENNSMRGVLLLSGDVHWAAAFEHRRGLYEFATSPIHTFPLFPNVLANAKGRSATRTLFTHTWTFHFAVVEVDTLAERPFVRHTTYAYLLDSANPQPVHEITLFIDDVQLSPSNKCGALHPPAAAAHDDESKLIASCTDDVCEKEIFL